MGCSSSIMTYKDFVKTNRKQHSIGDNYQTIEALQRALIAAGLESSQLTIGIDCTKSNIEQGKMSFGGRSLHDVSTGTNPYIEVITLIYKTLVAKLDDDGAVDVYGFGDIETRTTRVFSFNNFKPIRGCDNMIERYLRIVPSLVLSGQTSFAPLINETIDLIRADSQYRVLVIVADGRINDNGETRQAIIDASMYPLSIIMIGVGDGPFGEMETFDDDIIERLFDNFQFVNYSNIKNNTSIANVEVEFVRQALMELPLQYQYIKANRLLDRQWHRPEYRYRLNKVDMKPIRPVDPTAYV